VFDPQDDVRLREVEPDDWGFGTTKKDKKKNRFIIAVL
jgi:phenylpyruvate tautomerase PptA (4-oxalocrotonate tautomerase family)